MTTLTRNLRPFTPLDIPPINPFPLKIGLGAGLQGRELARWPVRTLAWLYPGFPPACPSSRVRGSVSSSRHFVRKHEDFPHCALLHISRQDLWDLSGRCRFRHRLLHRFRPKPRHDTKAVQPSSCRIVLISDLADCRTLLSFRPCLTVLTKTSCAAKPLCSTGITPLHRYYRPSRHPLAFHRLPGWKRSR